MKQEEALGGYWARWKTLLRLRCLGCPSAASPAAPAGNGIWKHLEREISIIDGSRGKRSTEFRRALHACCMARCCWRRYSLASRERKASSSTSARSCDASLTFSEDMSTAGRGPGAAMLAGGSAGAAAVTARSGIGGGACCVSAIILKNCATLFCEPSLDGASSRGASEFAAGDTPPSACADGCGAADVSEVSKSAIAARSGRVEPDA